MQGNFVPTLNLRNPRFLTSLASLAPRQWLAQRANIQGSAEGRFLSSYTEQNCEEINIVIFTTNRERLRLFN